ncbi:hypothetical protein [Nostoc sp. FACHB-892]|nr:hypothetical protein [Nostoc sp. FACHB-892]
MRLFPFVYLLPPDLKIKLWQKTKESMWLKTIDGDSPKLKVENV